MDEPRGPTVGMTQLNTIVPQMDDGRQTIEYLRVGNTVKFSKGILNPQSIWQTVDQSGADKIPMLLSGDYDEFISHPNVASHIPIYQDGTCNLKGTD